MGYLDNTGNKAITPPWSECRGHTAHTSTNYINTTQQTIPFSHEDRHSRSSSLSVYWNRLSETRPSGGTKGLSGGACITQQGGGCGEILSSCLFPLISPKLASLWKGVGGEKHTLEIKGREKIDTLHTTTTKIESSSKPEDCFLYINHESISSQDNHSLV